MKKRLHVGSQIRDSKGADAHEGAVGLAGLVGVAGQAGNVTGTACGRQREESE